ncbi:sulphur transport [Lucifera butyrica]|uniref:Sulphur transport n=1 Tax=Lucifera butyrica TaxID=1351585 RepID=A0A498R3D4_9FIRM|nr:YeeE/YedE thiosulfate transporter family protein [Lucifera butyrica]VBB05357.1 sulphur transport [Lucifera butyrica]
MEEVIKSTIIRKRSQAVPRKNQTAHQIAALVIVVGGAVLLARGGAIFSIIWFLGIGLGLVLQKSRFCFTASLRDPILTGSTTLTRATIIAFAVATVGFAALQFSTLLKGGHLIGFVAPVGIHIALGSMLFGIGMVISGGCASGTLMRMGEGFVMQWISLIGFIGGSVLGAIQYGWWAVHFFRTSHAIYLPNVFGWAGAFFGQLALLAALYVVATWWEYRKLN